MQFDDEMTSEVPRRKDVFFVPTFFNHGWAIEQNRLLARVFTSLPYAEDSYLPGKSRLLRYCADALPFIRTHKLTKVYFENIVDDFDVQFVRAAFVTDFYGFQHESVAISSRQEEAPHLRLTREFEDFIGSFATVFTSTHFYADALKYPTHVLGLPIFVPMTAPRMGSRILFSHRFVKAKGAFRLFELAEDMKRHLVVTTPFPPSPSEYSKLFARCKQELGMYVGLSKDVYTQLMGTCGFGLTFSTVDMFGISVLEGIFNGLMYFCYDNDGVPFREFMMKEFLFHSVEELVEKYHYYDDHFAERCEVVRAQQEKVQHYAWNIWLQKMLSYIP